MSGGCLMTEVSFYYQFTFYTGRCTIEAPYYLFVACWENCLLVISKVCVCVSLQVWLCSFPSCWPTGASGGTAGSASSSVAKSTALTMIGGRESRDDGETFLCKSSKTKWQYFLISLYMWPAVFRMATLLSRFRIDFSDINVLGDINTKPQKHK